MSSRAVIERIDTLQSIELGEGVEIRLRIAGPFPRALALMLDVIIMVVTAVIVWLLIGFVSGWGHHGEGMWAIFAFFFTWGYFVFFERGKRGATIGKRVVGLRVVDRTGNAATTGQIFVRNILRFVDMLPGIPTSMIGFHAGTFGVGLLVCLLSKKSQRIGDLVANTVVVYSQPIHHLQVQGEARSEVVAPSFALTREEQTAVVAYQERAGMWSVPRRIELADHAEALTKEKGEKGMIKLMGMANWLVDKK